MNHKEVQTLFNFRARDAAHTCVYLIAEITHTEPHTLIKVLRNITALGHKNIFQNG